MSEQQPVDVMKSVGLGNAFEDSWNSASRVVHEMAVSKGWWDDSADIQLVRDLVGAYVTVPHQQAEVLTALQPLAERNDAEMLCLIHSEVSEALEGLRHGNPESEKIPGFSNVEEELADVIIRMMDMAAKRDWDVGGAVAAKIQMNSGRSYKHGGKKF